MGKSTSTVYNTEVTLLTFPAQCWIQSFAARMKSWPT